MPTKYWRGSFEYALNEIVEEHLDMSVFEPRYHYDATGHLAYKKCSGTHKELEEKHAKLARVAERMVLRPFLVLRPLLSVVGVIVQRHRERDSQEGIGADSSSEPEKAKYYRRKVAEIRAFLEKNEKMRGPTGNGQKSNLTDPESAKMTSSHGVVQGYNGLAVVDGKAQIVVHAET